MRRTLIPTLLLATMVSFAGGSAQAAIDSRDVVRASQQQIVMSTFGLCVRTKWLVASDACAAPQVARKERTAIAKEDRTVYFAFNKASLDTPSKQRLDSLANVLKSDEDVQQANVVGFADRLGTASYNEKLSKRRADTVRRYLVDRGIINTRVAKTRWLGESEPRTNCSDDLPRDELIDCLQKDRRVEVEIEYKPENSASVAPR